MGGGEGLDGDGRVAFGQGGEAHFQARGGADVLVDVFDVEGFSEMGACGWSVGKAMRAGDGDRRSFPCSIAKSGGRTADYTTIHEADGSLMWEQVVDLAC